MTGTPEFLARILARKAEEVAGRRARRSEQALAEQIAGAPEIRGFEEALRRALAQGRPAVIAEMKRASPSQGVLCEHYVPQQIAAAYEQAGAACLSVLTDHDFFMGDDEHLVAARQACTLPVLRKDFIISRYQIVESRALGADCVLLIVAALEDAQLDRLYRFAREQGLDVLIEAHDGDELRRALDTGGTLIGINNRDLRSFATRLETTLALRGQVTGERVLVTESGIHNPQDVALMRRNGVHAFLVGEALMRASHPGRGLRELFFTDASRAGVP